MTNDKKLGPDEEQDEEFFEDGEEGSEGAVKTKSITAIPENTDPDKEMADFVKAARSSVINAAAMLTGIDFQGLLQAVKDSKDEEESFCSTDAPKEAKEPAKEPAPAKPADPLTTLDDSFKKSMGDAKGALDKLKPEELLEDKGKVIVDRLWQQKIVDLLKNTPDRWDKMPVHDKPVDLNEVKEKLQKNELEKLSKAELIAAVKLEATEGKFGPASQLAYKRSMDWFNSYSLNVYKDLVASGLRIRAGGPIPSFTFDKDVRTDFGAPPEAYKAKLLDPSFTVDSLKTMVEKKQINTQLVLDTTTKPGLEQLRRFGNASDWVEDTNQFLVKNNHRIEANRRYQVINEFLNIKDEGWKPPEDEKQLLSYCQRADEVTNLMFMVRNYAETIKSLSTVDGDFNELKALAEGVFPGKIEWDEKAKRITKMNLELPDSLAATPENERKLQKLRDWLEKYGPRVEQVLGDYMKGVPLRYGDFLESGKAYLGADGRTVRIADKSGNTHVAIVDGKLVTRNLDGVLRDGEKKGYKDEAVKPAHTKEEAFDYIGDKFSTSRDDTTGEIIVTTDRSFEKDHIINYNRWFGTQVAHMSETRRYRPDELVAVQTSSGLPQLIRADRLAEFQAIQALWHHGGKIATCAMDVGMVVTGSVGARAALQAGRMLYVATNVGRAALGLGGLLDPTFRQMGEVGESIRKARHAAILFDVTQGLLRRAPALAGSSKVLFETKAAAEVHQVIEASKVMNRLHSATTKVFGACDAVYLPMLSKDLIEKGRLNMGYNPRQMLANAVDQVGAGRKDVKPVILSAEEAKKATAQMLKVYDEMMGIKDAGLKEKVKQKFEAIAAKVGTDDATSCKNDDLARYWLASGDQLQALKKRNRDSIPRFHDDKELSGTYEEKVAAAIGLLHLSRTKDGKFPDDGVLVNRKVHVKEYEYEVPTGNEGETRTVHIIAEDVEQKIHLKDVIATLQKAAMDAPNPQTRAVAADALFRMGAMGSGRYAGILLEHLDKDATTDDNREARFKLMRQVADLIEITKHHEINPTEDPVARRFMDAENFGVSSDQLTRRMQEIAANEKDPDLRAMSMAILHARSHNDADTRIDAYYKQYEELKKNPGAFREAFLEQIKKELGTAIPENPKADREAAIELRLNAVKAYRNFEASKLEEETLKKVDLNKTLQECLKATGLRDIADKKPEDRTNLNLTLRIIDMMMARKDQLTADQRKDVARTATGIMLIPYPDKGEGRTEPALAKLAIIARMKDIYEDCEPNDPAVRESLKSLKSPMVTAMKDIITPKEPGEPITRGWGQYPEMRVAAITGLTSLGSIDRPTIDLLANFIDYDASKIGQEAFKERNPHVRAAATQALFNLAEYRLRYSEADIKALEQKSPKIRAELGLDAKLYVDELLKRERDPVALDVLWRVFDRKQRLDPQSADYDRLFALESEILNSAHEIAVSSTEVLNFVNSRKSLLAPTYFKGEVERSAEQNRKDPYSGFLGWCSSWVDSRQTVRKKNEDATADAKSVAFAEKNRERMDALTDLSKLGSMDPQEVEMAIKTLLHLIRHQDAELIQGGDLKYARIRASELLLRLCDGEANRDVVGNKQLLSKVVISALLDSSIDANPQVKYNLLKAVDRLTIKDTKKFNQNDGKEVWLITPERAAMVYAAALQREKQRFDKQHQEVDRESSRAIQMLCLERIYELRGHSAEFVLDARGFNEEWKKYLPDVSEVSRETLGALRYGVMHLLKDAVPDNQSSLSSRADFMRTALNDAKFNYEGACIAMFRACKDKPITVGNDVGAKGPDGKVKKEPDPRAEVLIEALNHPSERVRMTAALLLSDSKVNAHFMIACKALAELAVNGSHQRYQSDATALLRDIIQRGQPIEQDIAHGAWKNAFDARKALPKEKQPSAPAPTEPISIPEIEKLGVRAVPVSRMDSLVANGREQLSDGVRKAIEDERIATLAKISGRSVADIRRALEDPQPIKLREPVILQRNCLPCGGCHAPQQDRGGFTLSLRGYDPAYDFADLTKPRAPGEKREPSAALKKAMEDLRKEDAVVNEGPAPGYQARREARLARLELQSGIYPFVSESLERGKPEIGRPVWGQVRHRETDKLQPAEKATQNESLASSLLELKLAQAENGADKIAALKEACTRTPINAATDRRVGRVMDLLKDKDEAVRIEAATLVLRGSKADFVNKAFTEQQRAKAYEVLNASAPSLIQKGINGNDAKALEILDRAMETKDNQLSVSLVADVVMKRSQGWEKGSALLSKHMTAEPFRESLPDGSVRETRKVPQGIVCHDMKNGELTKVVTPDQVKFVDILLSDIEGNTKQPAERLNLARTILDTKVDIGCADSHKARAAIVLSNIVLDATASPALRLEAAQRCLACGFADVISRDRALRSLLAMAEGSGAESAPAKALLDKLDKTAAQVVISMVNADLKTKLHAATAQSKAKLSVELCEKYRTEPSTEASAYKLYQLVSKMEDKDLLAKVERVLDRTRTDSVLTPISGKDDPRLEVMSTLVSEEKVDFLHVNAALALLDKGSKDVPEKDQQNARAHVHRFVKNELETLRQNPGAKASDWELLDKVLEKSGQSKDDYSRLYVRSKQLECNKDYKELVPVYEALAKISKDRESPEAESIFNALAGEAKEFSDPAITQARKDFADALRDATADFDQGKNVEQAEKKLQEKLEALCHKAGADSRNEADANMELAAYYQKTGNLQKATEASDRSTKIMEQRARATVQHMAPAAAGGAVRESKVGTRQLASNPWGGFGESVTVKDNQRMNDMVDYQFSMGVVGTDAVARAKALSQRSLNANETVFGTSSPQATAARVNYGDMLQATGNGFEAEGVYRDAMNNLPINSPDRAKVTGKLAGAMMKGGPDATVRAIEMMEQTVQTMHKTGAPPTMVANQMREYAKLVRDRGDFNLASEMEQRATTMQNTGQLTTPTRQSHYARYGTGNGGGPTPGGPGGPLPGGPGGPP